MKLEIHHALVMAAGRGMRMRPLTDQIPKAMAPLGESTLISEGIKKLKKQIKNVHITVGYKGAMLASHVIEKDVSSVINTEGKGNSWWIYNSLIKELDEPICMQENDSCLFINEAEGIIADEMDFSSFAQEYNKFGSPACMLVPVKPVLGIDGDFILKDKNNLVLEISRDKISNLYSSGIQIINPKKINEITDNADNFSEVWSQLIKQRQLVCSKKILDKWYSVDNLTQIKEL